MTEPKDVDEQIDKDHQLALEFQMREREEMKEALANRTLKPSRSLRRNLKPVFYGETKLRKQELLAVHQQAVLDQIICK